MIFFVSQNGELGGWNLVWRRTHGSEGIMWASIFDLHVSIAARFVGLSWRANGAICWVCFPCEEEDSMPASLLMKSSSAWSDIVKVWDSKGWIALYIIILFQGVWARRACPVLCSSRLFHKKVDIREVDM